MKACHVIIKRQYFDLFKLACHDLFFSRRAFLIIATNKHFVYANKEAEFIWDVLLVALSDPTLDGLRV